MKIVINKCFGGFGLSDKAFEKLIEYGLPVHRYIEQERDPETMLFKPHPLDGQEVIFDRSLEAGDNPILSKDRMISLMGRYWATWLDGKRTHPLLIRVVEELGPKANGQCAELHVVEIPDDVQWGIHEYDGFEHVEEKHRTWA